MLLSNAADRMCSLNILYLFTGWSEQADRFSEDLRQHSHDTYTF